MLHVQIDVTNRKHSFDLIYSILRKWTILEPNKSMETTYFKIIDYTRIKIVLGRNLIMDKAVSEFPFFFSFITWFDTKKIWHECLCVYCPFSSNVLLFLLQKRCHCLGDNIFLLPDSYDLYSEFQTTKNLKFFILNSYTVTWPKRPL